MSEATLAIIVHDQADARVREAGVIFNFGLEGWTNRDGYAAFQVPTDVPIQFSVHKPGYDTSDAPVVTIHKNTDYWYLARRNVLDVRPLHVEGTRFVDDLGQDYIWKGATNFLLFQRFLEWQEGRGPDIEPLLYAGAEVYRVTLVMKYIPNLIGLRTLMPETYPTYWSGLDAFAQFLHERGKRFEATVWCDIQMLGVDRRWLQRYLDQANEILNARPNAFGELVNEYPKNGVNPLDFERPAGAMLWSRGSGLVDAPPARPGWDFFGWHGRRDWPKVTSSAEDMWYVSNGSDGYRSMVGIHDEPVGFGEQTIDGKRSTNPRLARQIAETSVLLGRGGTYHCEEAVFSRPLGPNQQVCARAFYEGLA